MHKNIAAIFTKINQSARPKICVNIAKWCEERNFSSLVIGPAVISEIRNHVDLDPAILACYNDVFDILKREQCLVNIENACIRDEIGFLELPDGQLCCEGNWHVSNLIENPAYSRRSNYKKRYLKGNWYSLLSLWGPMYYHWFHDVLPRLENALNYLPSDTRFLINKSPFEYQLKSLESYGISGDRLEYQSNQLHTKIQHLWFATPLGHEKFGSIKTIKKVVHRLKNYFKIEDRPKPKKYISPGKMLLAEELLMNMK